MSAAAAAPIVEEEEKESEESIAEKKAAIQDEIWESFNGQLQDLEFLVRKAKTVGKMELKMRGEYEKKGREIGESSFPSFLLHLSHHLSLLLSSSRRATTVLILARHLWDSLQMTAKPS